LDWEGKRGIRSRWFNESIIGLADSKASPIIITVTMGQILTKFKYFISLKQNCMVNLIAGSKVLTQVNF
jgi:hypothetical protein